MYLFIGELIIVIFITIVRYFIKRMETKKIDTILEFIDNKSKQTKSTDRFRECLEIIKQNNRMEDDYIGK